MVSSLEEESSPRSSRHLDRSSSFSSRASFRRRSSITKSVRRVNSSIDEIAAWGRFEGNRAYYPGARPLIAFSEGETLQARREAHAVANISARGKEEWKILRILLFPNADEKDSKADAAEDRWFPLWRKALGPFFGTMPAASCDHLPLPFLNACLRGIAQVVFCNNPVTGLFILAALFVDSPWKAVAGVVGLLASTASAQYVIGVDTSLVNSGLLGYNGVLVGLFMAEFGLSSGCPTCWDGWLLIPIVVVAIFSSVIFVAMGNVLAASYGVPPLTFPFNFAVLLWLTGSFSYNYFPSRVVPDLVDPIETQSTTLLDYDGTEIFQAWIRGIGQIFLASDWRSGFIILAGISVCSPILTFTAALGSLVGLSVALAMGVSGQGSSGLYWGLASYNSALTLQALLFFFVPSWRSLMLGIVASIMASIASFAVSNFLMPNGQPAGTFAFCFVTVSFLLIQASANGLVPIPLTVLSTPEEHLRNVRRYERLSRVLLSVLEQRASGKKGVASLLDSQRRRTSTTGSMAFSFLKVEPSPELAAFFERVDTDDSGGLSQIELLAALGQYTSDETLLQHARDTLDDLWTMAGCEDATCTISLDELARLVEQRRHTGHTFAKLRRLFVALDADQNRRLSYRELALTLDFCTKKNADVIREQLGKLFVEEVGRRVRDGEPINDIDVLTEKEWNNLDESDRLELATSEDVELSFQQFADLLLTEDVSPSPVSRRNLFSKQFRRQCESNKIEEEPSPDDHVVDPTCNLSETGSRESATER